MIDPILNHHFKSFKSAFEIDISSGDGGIDREKESAAFEKFVNYTIFSSDYPDIFTADLDLLDFVCIGGSHDTGIDGIGIKINDRLIRDIEEIGRIAKNARKINVEFVFIQAKMSSGINIGDFNKFGLGVKNFFSPGYLPENKKIKAIREIKDFIYSDQLMISKFAKNPSLTVYYVITGSEPINDSNYLGSKKILKNELTAGEVFFDKIDIKGVGGKQLIKTCRELENKFEVQLNIVDIFPLIVDMQEEISKAYTFTCSAKEFLKILSKDDGTIRRSLFNDNVRDYIGTMGPVNSEIEETIIDNPRMFLLCNNGITIVCSNFEQVRDKLIKIENPQIVNGCQTSNSIFNLKDHENINSIQILVRIISTDSIDITNKIVRGTNKQNQVLDEAFEAILPFHQEILEPFFLAFDKHTKIYYERRSKQYNNDPLIKKTQIVNLRILTQTFVAIFLESPHEAHRHEAKLLEKYACDIETRVIFKENHNPYMYYICALIWYKFEKAFREDKIDKKHKPYKAHLYLLFRYSIGEFPPSFSKTKAIDKYCNKLLTQLDNSKFISAIQKIFDVFERTKNLYLSKGKSKYGIKESKEFVNLLVKNARLKFIQGKIPSSSEETVSPNEGEILNIIWRYGVWFGFIKRSMQKDNLYFDSRGFTDDVNRLIPHQKVRYIIGRGSKGDFARHVEIIN